MSRASRLLDLIAVLRQHRRPVTGARLAQTLSISLRTLYRDIDTLKAQGAEIAGEAGLGYVLKPGFMLPPLMFTEDEIEALVIGSRWVASRTDAPLGDAARSAVAKIAAVLPADLRQSLETAPLIVGPGPASPPTIVDLAALRDAIRRERKIEITYDDGKATTQRTIWPFILAFFDSVRIVGGWCELRQDIRAFRLDRIRHFVITDSRYPQRRQKLLMEWRERERVTDTLLTKSDSRRM